MRAFGSTTVGAGELLMQAQQLSAGAPRGITKGLGEVSDRAAGVARTSTDAVDTDPAGRRTHEPAHRLDESRLPGAVGAEQADELTRLQGHVDATQRRTTPVTLD